MYNKKIPCLFFPTKVVLVDDDIDFLKNLLICLPKESSSYSVFSNPALALCSMDEAPALTFEKQAKYSSEKLNETRVDFSIQNIHKEIYNDRRFDNVSVVVVDYDMPEINGIEFCKKITNPNIQKIMLTGEADDSIAVNAFNEGIIDRFVKKGGKDALKELKKAIHDCQVQYFSSLTKQVLNAITMSSDDVEPSALASEAYKDLVGTMISEQGVLEYYLMDSTGSLLMVDGKGRGKGLFVQNSDQIETIADEARSSSQLDKKSLEQLAAGKMILSYFPSDEKPLPEASKWGKHLSSSTRLGDKFRYAVNEKKESFLVEDILSFEDYLSK